MCEFLRNCLNTIITFQIGFLIKFHQILNPHLENEFEDDVLICESTEMEDMNGMKIKVINEDENFIIEEQPKLHNIKEAPNINMEIHEMSMKDKTVNDLEEIAKIRELYEKSQKGQLRKRIVKKSDKSLETIKEELNEGKLQEFDSNMILDEEKHNILLQKEVWNKTGIC